MEMKECAEKTDAFIERKRRELESIEILGSLVTECLRAPAVRMVVLSVLRNLLSSWSEGSRTKQKIFERALKLAEKNIAPQSPYSAGIDAQKVGKLLTLLAQSLNDKQKQNPMYLADHLEGPLSEIIKHIDFGEVKEMVDRAEDPIVELVRRLMGLLWNTYPAKFGTVITLVHPVGNMTVRSLKEIIKPLNEVSPDLLTDLIFTIVRSIDGREIGELTNAVMEMVRQLHTGSLLQGESGVPQFQMDLTNKLREIMSGIDPELLCKVKVIAAEMAEERSNAISDILDENPALVLDLVSRFSSLKNPRIRATHRRMRVFDHLDGEFAAAVGKGLGEIDTQEIGEMFNTLLRLFNKVHTEKPDFISRLLGDIFVNIDTDEMKTATEWLMRDVIEGLKPIAREVLPILIHGLGELNQCEETK
ncbi:MAG: hypothetical protein NT072_04695 [Deltaproteobacteria bacterium]|nr:hypothetical protein [Deltaproteobacteria bacterium]